MVCCTVWFCVSLNKCEYPSTLLCRMHGCGDVCVSVCLTLPHAALVLSVQVVPLSQRSGVLEWCTGTTPIGEFLVNADKGAHKRYRPHDYSSLQCQKIMMVSQNN